MIIIDMKMPQRCAECPCFSDSIYGHCNVKDIWLGADDGAWFSDHRPNWCPLQEQEAVEPIVSTAEQRCGHCNKVIEMDGWQSCPWCGKRIDWKGWWKKNGTRNQDS